MKAVNALPAAVRPPGRVAAPPFADVVAEHLDPVYRYLVYLTGDRTAAEDLAAETFEKAFRSWRRYDPRRAAPRTWLCSIARSVAVDWFRAETRRKRREENYERDRGDVAEFGPCWCSPRPRRSRSVRRSCTASARRRPRRLCSGTFRAPCKRLRRRTPSTAGRAAAERSRRRRARPCRPLHRRACSTPTRRS